jgi:hypothetical protein
MLINVAGSKNVACSWWSKPSNYLQSMPPHELEICSNFALYNISMKEVMSNAMEDNVHKWNSSLTISCSTSCSTIKEAKARSRSLHYQNPRLGGGCLSRVSRKIQFPRDEIASFILFNAASPSPSSKTYCISKTVRPGKHSF